MSYLFIHTRVQGGENGGVGIGSKAGLGGSGSCKGDSDAKGVGKVLST